MPLDGLLCLCPQQVLRLHQLWYHLDLAICSYHQLKQLKLVVLLLHRSQQHLQKLCNLLVHQRRSVSNPQHLRHQPASTPVLLQNKEVQLIRLPWYMFHHSSNFQTNYIIVYWLLQLICHISVEGKGSCCSFGCYGTYCSFIYLYEHPKEEVYCSLSWFHFTCIFHVQLYSNNIFNRGCPSQQASPTVKRLFSEDSTNEKDATDRYIF